MYIYEWRSAPGLREHFAVGHYQPGGTFQYESSFATRAEASARVHYLNGGTSADRCDCEETLEKIRALL